MIEVTVEEFVKNFEKYMYGPENGEYFTIMEDGQEKARFISMFRAEVSKDIVVVRDGQEIREGETRETTPEEFIKNFNQHLEEVTRRDVVVIVENGKKIARLVGTEIPYLIMGLRGILKTNYTKEDIIKEMTEEMVKKYESLN